MNNKYEDIINLPHHVSTKHKQMSMYERAAQFAPYAALTGHKDSIEETARMTERELDIDEEEKEILDRKLQNILEKINFKLMVSFTYFVPDLKKEGGRYINIIGIIKKIDNFEKVIYLDNNNNTKIPIKDIIDIQIIEEGENNGK